MFAVGLLDAGEVIREFEFREGPTGNEETGGVGGSPVSEAMLDTVALELVRVCGTEHFVTRDLRRNDLNHDVTIGEAHYQAVFRGIVFVFCLSDEALAGIVISFTSTTAFVFSLIAANEVC